MGRNSEGRPAKTGIGSVEERHSSRTEAEMIYCHFHDPRLSLDGSAS
jgi:hypothetical protein